MENQPEPKTIVARLEELVQKLDSNLIATFSQRVVTEDPETHRRYAFVGTVKVYGIDKGILIGFPSLACSSIYDSERYVRVTLFKRRKVPEDWESVEWKLKTENTAELTGINGEASEAYREMLIYLASQKKIGLQKMLLDEVFGPIDLKIGELYRKLKVGEK